MKIQSEWKGNVDSENKSGIGTWHLLNKIHIKIELSSFTDFNKIEEMLKSEYSRGRYDAIDDCTNVVRNVKGR